jgi:hypothetical protein
MGFFSGLFRSKRLHGQTKIKSKFKIDTPQGYYFTNSDKVAKRYYKNGYSVDRLNKRLNSFVAVKRKSEFK